MGINSIQASLHLVKSERVKYFLVVLVLFISSAGSPVAVDDRFIFAVFAITGIMFLWKRNRLDLITVYVVSAWIIINILAFSFLHEEIDMYTSAGFIVKIFYPYFILKLVGEGFWEKFERIVFVLALISIPLFALQLLFPSMFFSAAHYLNFMTRDEQKAAGGWYAGIFMFNAWGPQRNSGFMWEEGAFAFMLTLVLGYRIARNGIAIDRRNLIYLAALGTTLSTMGYAVLLMIILIYILRQRKFLAAIVTAIAFIAYGATLVNLYFLLPKIDYYVATVNNLYTPTGQEYLKYNRLGYFLYAVNSAIKWPWGYGLVESTYQQISGSNVEGVGTISDLLVYWGWLGILFFFGALYKFARRVRGMNDPIVVIGVTIMLIFAFFSNPMAKNPMLYTVVFYPFVFEKVSDYVSV